jgi:hypothetical protein
MQDDLTASRQEPVGCALHDAIENLEAVWPAILHAVKKIQGDMEDCVKAESAADKLDL